MTDLKDSSVQQTSPLESTDHKVQHLQNLMAHAPSELLDTYYERLRMSWVYHDAALEGIIYAPTELDCALSGQTVTDPAMIPIVDEIRQYKTAIDIVRELTDKKRSGNVSLEVIKKIYTCLAPDEVEGKGAIKYRKDMPVHRLYFHDIAPPDKIGYRMRLLVQWINAPETKRSIHPVRLASRAHAELLHIYPFPKHSGRVARLLMNLILLRNGYPPAIVHMTERQRYYEALKQSVNAVAAVIHDSLLSSVDAGIRFFESSGTA